MNIKEEIKRLDLVIYKGYYQKALQKVEEIGKTPGLTNKAKIRLLLRKSEILDLLGEYDQSFDIAHHSYLESENQKEPLFVIDSIIRKSFSLMASFKYDECNALAELAEGLINNHPKMQSNMY